MDFDALSTKELVVQYVLECRGRGLQLAYHDYEIISGWVNEYDQRDELIGILSDILPAYFEKRAQKSVPPSLKGVQRKVLRKLKDKRMHT